MLDENLPTFYLKDPSAARQPQKEETVYYSQYGSELQPSYSLVHPDPSKADSKNRYAAALYDSYNPEILYAEVLLIPEWTKPSLSAETIRANGGVAPSPEPILPTEFVIQLYNPDQQVKVKQAKSTWNKTPTWEFEFPQQTFRLPSASSLDRTQHDPVALDLTPKIGFRWKKDGKFGKDLACYHSGKVVDPSKKKSKEPDITVAIFKALREVTLYEPNLQRIEVEDLKGFEVILLLGAIVIRDVYFGQMKETFNISDPGTSSQSAAVAGLYSSGNQSTPKPTRPPHAQHKSSSKPARDPRVPPTDPRSQWEIDAQTARLKQQAEAQDRERKRQEQLEEKRIKKMLELEEKEKRRKQVEVDKETERLKRIYGKDDARARPTLPPRHPNQTGYPGPNPYERPVSHPQIYASQPRPGAGPYLGVPHGPSNASTNNLAAPSRLKNKSNPLRLLLLRIPYLGSGNATSAAPATLLVPPAVASSTDTITVRGNLRSQISSASYEGEVVAGGWGRAAGVAVPEPAKEAVALVGSDTATEDSRSKGSAISTGAKTVDELIAKITGQKTEKREKKTLTLKGEARENEDYANKKQKKKKKKLSKNEKGLSIQIINSSQEKSSSSSALSEPERRHGMDGASDKKMDREARPSEGEHSTSAAGVQQYIMAGFDFLNKKMNGGSGSSPGHDDVSPRSFSDQRILLYLPSGPFYDISSNGADRTVPAAEKDEPPPTYSALPSQLSSLLPPTTTILTVQYRLSASPLHRFKYPLPVHDVLFAWDWIVENFFPRLFHFKNNGEQSQDAKKSPKPLMSLYGSHLGASLATVLALTESRLLHSVAISTPILNWADLDEEISFISHQDNSDPVEADQENRASKTTKRQRKSNLKNSSDVHRLLRLRQRLFTRPSAYFDPFASPMLLLRAPGRDCPLDNMFATAKTEEDVEQIMLSDLESNYNFANEDPSSSSESGSAFVSDYNSSNSLSSYGPYDDDLSSHSGLSTTEAVTKRRKVVRAWPPRGTMPEDVQLPYFKAIVRDERVGEERILREQGQEMVDLMERACFRSRSAGCPKERVGVEKIGWEEGVDMERRDAEVAAKWIAETWMM
ncbi:MAG: hypothetical protein Q9227_008081 [Pyrenula ochraceoflavens]